MKEGDSPSRGEEADAHWAEPFPSPRETFNTAPCLPPSGHFSLAPLSGLIGLGPGRLTWPLSCAHTTSHLAGKPTAAAEIVCRIRQLLTSLVATALVLASSQTGLRCPPLTFPSHTQLQSQSLAEPAKI